jgi:hypothetical protein
MFRFTIRDLLWLMVVVAVALGWWADHPNSAKTREALAKAAYSSEFYHRVISSVSDELRKVGRDIDIHKNGSVSFVELDSTPLSTSDPFSSPVPRSEP